MMTYMVRMRPLERFGCHRPAELERDIDTSASAAGAEDG